MTNREPIILTESRDHCYLQNGEFSNNIDANIFMNGTIVYDDKFENVHEKGVPLTKVKLFPFIKAQRERFTF